MSMILTNFISLYSNLLCSVETLTRPGEYLSACQHLLSVLVLDWNIDVDIIEPHIDVTVLPPVHPGLGELGLKAVDLPPVLPHVGQHLCSKLKRSRLGLGVHVIKRLANILKLSRTHL